MPNAGELWREFQKAKEKSPSIPRAQRQFVGRQKARLAYFTLLTRFRAQVMEQRSGTVFPLFDLALLRLSRKYGRRMPPDEEKASLSDNPVVAFALDVVGDLTGAGLLIGAGQMAAGIFQSMRRKLADRKLCIRQANTEINQMSAPELVRYLPYYFAMDVNAMELPLVCVYLDTYEKMSSFAEGAGQSTGFDEKRLWDKQGLVRNLGNAVFAIAGREALDTESAGKDGVFQTAPGEAHDGANRPVGIFSREDSAAFLTGRGIRDQALHSELYELTGGNPFYLDLCVDEYEHQVADGRQPRIGEGFGKTNERLAERYLRYVPHELRDAVRLLCALGQWTDELYGQLAQRMGRILPQEGEAGYSTIIHLTYVERFEQGWRVQRSVAEILARGLSAPLRRRLADALAETASRETEELTKTGVRRPGEAAGPGILLKMENAPVTAQTARAMEAWAEAYTQLCRLDKARLWQERALEQWKVIKKNDRCLGAAGRLTDILNSMALYGERDQILRQGIAFARELGRDAPVEEAVALWERQAGYSQGWEEDAAARENVWRLRQGQKPAPPDRVLWMAQCRLGWALHNCDEPDPRTSGLLKEAFERLKEADAAENRPFTPHTLFAAEALCQFAEEKDDPQLLEETKVWMRELSYTLTDMESPEELRTWQEWLDFMEGQADNFHCGQKPEKLFVLQKQVMQGLRRHLGEHHPEALKKCIREQRIDRIAAAAWKARGCGVREMSIGWMRISGMPWKPRGGRTAGEMNDLPVPGPSRW